MYITICVSGVFNLSGRGCGDHHDVLAVVLAGVCYIITRPWLAYLTREDRVGAVGFVPRSLPRVYL